jgi:type VI secretion system secreted protein VgrG
MASSVGPLKVTTPLGGDVLRLRRMVGRETLGRLFEYELDLLSEDGGVNLNALLGKTMTVSVELPAGGYRHFDGRVAQISLVGMDRRHYFYRATLRPWLWLLTRTANCRIFQNLSVPDIVKQVFRSHGLTDFDESLSESHRVWDYRVQYRETDFNFISRLLEHDGIYYFFRHQEGKHHLVLADGYSAHAPASGYASVPFFPEDEHRRRKADHLYGWRMSHELQPGVFASTDFDFEKPKTNLLAKLKSPSVPPEGDFEIFDPPGDYRDSGGGESTVKSRIEELQAQHEQLIGTGNARGVGTGALFKLTDFPRADQNREYLVVSSSYELVNHELEASGGTAPAGEDVFRSTLLCVESQRPFRAPRLTPRPTVGGPQTATVVGKGGEEIWTDKYGRVKLQFHWDRYGTSDENSSCWVRVSQTWAGAGWGAMHIPRIGQEVIVDFLEGDPDRPIVTGRVYNADNMPPYELPGNQTQSGLKSRSTKGGTASNFNEIRFEDKKGAEQMFVHAEKNRDIVVKNDETHDVGHDRSKTVGNDETTTITGNRTESVGKDETITITGARKEDVGKDETIAITGARTESVGKDEKISITGGRTEDVGKDEKISIGGNRTEDVAKDEKISITGGRTESVTKDEAVTVSGKRSHSVGKDDTLSVGKKLLIDAGEEIVLRTGSASVTLKKNGDIVIKGKDITVDGSGKINVKASSDVIIKGSKVSQN